MNAFQHYTYIHRCKDDPSRIFYVGKGSGNRCNSHLFRNKYWHSIVKKHGLLVEKIADWKSHEEAIDHEIFLIKCFSEMGIKLCNLTKGGDGVVGWKHSEETKKIIKLSSTGRKTTEETKRKISISNTGNKSRTGHKNSEEHKAKTAAIWKGKKLSEEHKLKLSLAKKGKKWSPEIREKMMQARLKKVKK
jgi:hypothetical protein